MAGHSEDLSTLDILPAPLQQQTSLSALLHGVPHRWLAQSVSMAMATSPWP